MCRRRSIAVIDNIKHGNGLQRCLLGQGQLFADAGHGVDGIFQLHIHEVLEPCNGVGKLSEELVEGLLKLLHGSLATMLHCDTASHIDGTLTAHEHSSHLCGGTAGVGGGKADARHILVCHPAAVCLEECGIGPQQLGLLGGQRPVGGGDAVIAVAVLELSAVKAVIQHLGEDAQELVDGQDGVILAVTGVDCGDLFIPHEDECLRLVLGQAGIDHITELRSGQVIEDGSAQLGTVKEALVCGVAEGVMLTVQPESELEVHNGVLHRFLTDAGCERARRGKEDGGRRQGNDVEGTDAASLPLAVHRKTFMEGLHFGGGLEVDVRIVSIKL